MNQNGMWQAHAPDTWNAPCLVADISAFGSSLSDSIVSFGPPDGLS
jgi:hypothetical protein